MLGRLLVLLVVALGTQRVRSRDLVRDSGGGELTAMAYVQDRLTDTAQTMLVVLAMWMLLAALAGALRRLPGAVGRAANVGWRLLVPTAVRLAVGAVVATQVVAAPAWATHDNAAGPAPAVSGSHPAMPRVDRPFTTAPAKPGPAVDPAPSVRRTVRKEATSTVVVRPGDSLWAIAQRSLTGSPSPADVAREWPRWYRQNRARIGDDPNVIVVGTVLSPPQSAGATSHGTRS
jgi:nucleoid-associated protein YgaU